MRILNDARRRLPFGRLEPYAAVMPQRPRIAHFEERDLLNKTVYPTLFSLYAPRFCDRLCEVCPEISSEDFGLNASNPLCSDASLMVDSSF